MTSPSTWLEDMSRSGTSAEELGTFSSEISQGIISLNPKIICHAEGLGVAPYISHCAHRHHSILTVSPLPWQLPQPHTLLI